MRNDWDQREDESDKEYQLFLGWLTTKYPHRFHKVKSRSIRGHAEALGQSELVLYKLSSMFSWADRASAYDAHQNRVRLMTIEEQNKQMARRHARTARLMIDKGVEALKNTPIDEIGVSDQVKLIAEGTKIERLSRGEATERVASVDEVDLSKLSDEELALYASLREKAKKG